MALNCTLVDVDSMFYTSVQGTYFYHVIFGTKFKFSENQSTLRFHYPYWAPSILLRSRHYGSINIDFKILFSCFQICSRMAVYKPMVSHWPISGSCITLVGSCKIFLALIKGICQIKYSIQVTKTSSGSSVVFVAIIFVKFYWDCCC